MRCQRHRSPIRWLSASDTTGLKTSIRSIPEGMHTAADIGGETTEGQIPPLGVGSDDLHMLHVLQESAYRGPIGILNNTGKDAAAPLSENLDGLQWLVQKLDGKPQGPKSQNRKQVEQ